MAVPYQLQVVSRSDLRRSFVGCCCRSPGDRDINLQPTYPHSVLRLAVAVTLLGSLLVALSTVVLLTLTGYNLDVVLLNRSAFATGWAFNGHYSRSPSTLQNMFLQPLMFAGRTGTMTLAAARSARSASSNS